MIYDARDCASLRIGVMATSAAAWVLMLATPEHSCSCLTEASGSSLAQLVAARSLWSAVDGWLVMLVAMMAPMTLPALYQIRRSSFVRRRSSSSALFLLGYCLVWTGAGAVLIGIEVVAKWHEPGSFAPALLVALAALVWQASPAKQRCLNRCHSHRSLSAFGLAAARDALLMGLSHGVWCVGSCWAIMLFPMLLPDGHLSAMAAVTLLMLCERLDPPASPAWRLRGFLAATRWLHLKLFGPQGSSPPYASARGSAVVSATQPSQGQ